MKILESGEPRDSCPNCGSAEIVFDKAYGFYKCNSCEHVWAHDEDDPDYDECDEYWDEYELDE